MKNIKESQERKERILNSGVYTRCEIIMPKIEQNFAGTLIDGIDTKKYQPVVILEKTRGVGTVETAILIKSLKQCEKVLSNQNPLASFLAENMEIGAEVYDANGEKTGEVKI